MTKNKQNVDLFKEPNQFVQNLGELPIVISLISSEKYQATCVAMGNVAKAEEKDDVARKNGNDDYSISLQKLINAFDAFIKEFSKGKSRTGIKKNYELSDPCELTIYLLWQIRNTWTHNGGLIDKKCKRTYGRILNVAPKSVKPIIPLPEVLEIGHEFSINFSNYKLIKKCILGYIEKRVPKEDFEILRKRSSISNVTINSCKAFIKLETGVLVFEVSDAYACGCKDFKIPPNAFYDPMLKRVMLRSVGKSFPAELLENKS